MQRDKQILTLFWKNKKTSTRIRTYRPENFVSDEVLEAQVLF
jgi:hypothetical protein